jgi:signal transduction histidine kinase
MADRPGRRARRSLLLAGLLLAAAVLVVGATAAGLGASWPPLPVTAVLAAAAIGLGALAGSVPGLRRASSRVLVTSAGLAAVAGAVVLGLCMLVLVLGRLPNTAEGALVGPAVAAAVVASALAGPLGRRAAGAVRSALLGARRSPDELLADVAERAGRDVAIDDVLRRLAESMRRDWRLARVELWTGVGADAELRRGLVVPQPVDDDPDAEPPAPLTRAEQAALRRAGVAGPGWLRVWLPRLLEHRSGGRQLRLAPAVHAGRVLALVVIERSADADVFTGADERALAEVARRLAIVLRNRVLDEQLQMTLADLRRTNADLQASRRRLVAAADAERRRIERDLHDGAQQHLVALAVGLRLVRDELRSGGGDSPEPALLDELDRGVREAIATLRDLAHGIYPPLLRDGGLTEALRVAAARSRAQFVTSGVGRYPEQVEAAVYFCCLEALQNAAKHASGAHVELWLVADEDALQFSVTDGGPGFEVGSAPGAGLQNMADRVGAVGGSVECRSARGAGTTVAGSVPLPEELEPGTGPFSTVGVRLLGVR